MIYDIFISYKRLGVSKNTASALYNLLVQKGYNVFLDRKELRSGDFNKQLLEHISNATDIIILLEEDSLNSWFCNRNQAPHDMDTETPQPYKTDWFCREVMHALSQEGKNIIPILLDGYRMPLQEDLPSDMRGLALKNALELSDIIELDNLYDTQLNGKEYLISKPKNLAVSRQYRNRGAIVGQYLFYTDASSCELYEQGDRIITLTDDNDEDHPFCYPVSFAGEHRFRLVNNDTCEELRIIRPIEVNSQTFIEVHWENRKSLWKLSEEQIAEQTDANLLFCWGKALFEGNIKNNPDYDRAARCMEQAVKRGNSDAVEYLRIHGNIDPYISTNPETLRWEQVAAANGNADSQQHLGFRYFEGINVEKNQELGVEWYQKAAEQGEPNAMLRFGFMYEKGRYFDQDYAKAAEWYHKAAEGGRAMAAYRLSFMYEAGHGMSPSPEKAREYMLKAAEGDLCFAQIRIAKKLHMEGNDEEALVWVEKALSDKVGASMFGTESIETVLSVYGALNRRKEALHQLESIVKYADNSESHYLRSQELIQQKIEELRKAEKE